jgi:L-rhamnose mutarotase
MESAPVNSLWQADMDPFFDLPDGRPDRGMRLLDLVFDLDAQLTAHTTAPIGETA